MAINLGTTAISDVKLGSTQVNKIYLGATEVWSKGGSGSTDWGVLSYRSGASIEYVAQDARKCTVNSINTITLEAFLAQQEDPSEIMFRYKESMGGWQFGWGGGDTIPTEDMLATTGVNVTLDEGAQSAEIRIEKSVVIDPSSPLVSVALTQAEYNSLGNAESYTIHGVNVLREAIEGFSFGSLATTTPNDFLMETNVSSLDFTYADSLTTIGDHFLGNSSFNQPLALPNTVTTIGDYFLVGINFNQPLVLSSALTTIGNGFLYQAPFNQPLVLPNGLTTIGSSFLDHATSFNQPLTLPDSLTSIGAKFLTGCNSLTSTINLGNCPASITYGSSDDGSTFAATKASAPAYTIGITIVGAYAADWKAKFPDRSTGYARRKLLIG